MADVEIEQGESDHESLDVPLEPEDEGVRGELDPLLYDEDSPNLVNDFLAHPKGKKFLQEVSETVLTNFKKAWEGAEQFRERFKANWSLFAGELPPKELPWPGAANFNIPIMLENLSRLVTRAESELFGDWRNVFGVEAISINDIDRRVAETMNAHGNWQIREQIPDFKRQLGQRGLLAYFWIGDVTAHSFYDPERMMNRHEILTPEDFVVPYTFTTTMPDYSDCPWICKIVHYQRHQVEAKRGEWADVDAMLDGKPPSFEDEPEQSITDDVARAQGIEPPDGDSDKMTPTAPYKVLWFEGWMRLPEQEKDRYVQVLVHESSRAVLKLTFHEEDDWQDRQRYLQQERELGQFRQAQMEHQMQVMHLQQTVESFAQSQQMGMAPPELAAQAMEQAQQQMPPEPPPPTWMKPEQVVDPMAGPAPARRVPCYMFAHGVCIENFVGPYGLSYGRIQGDLNRGANAMFNQFIDAATLANVSSFLVTDGVDFGTSKPLKPGTVNRVKGVIGDELSKNIMPLKFGQANPQLMEGVSHLENSARSSMQAPEVLSGEPGKSGETYRGISARIEQATKQLSVYVQHYAFSPLEQVLKNNAKLNAKFLREEELVQIATSKNGPAMPFKVTREMYDQNYKATISADLRFATQAQRIQEADELAGLMGKNPILAQNPKVMEAVTTKQLRARGMDEMIPLVQEAFKAAQHPPGAAPPGAGGPPGAGAPPQPGAMQ